MKIWPDRILCIIRMSLNTAQLRIETGTEIRSYMDWLLQLSHFIETDWNFTPPDIIHDVWNS